MSPCRYVAPHPHTRDQPPARRDDQIRRGPQERVLGCRFADWELGPVQAFEDRWLDPQFKFRAEAFLQKFVGPHDDKPLRAPALLCRKGTELDGEEPSNEEFKALQLSIAFTFLDGNPRYDPESQQGGSAVITSDNTELYGWPVDLEKGHVTQSTGLLVRTTSYWVDSPTLIVKPPLDLHMPTVTSSPDPLLLAGIYETVLKSLRSPRENRTANQVRLAVEWLEKAWRNTATVLYPERLVFLKTAFEAITGTSTNWRSARRLRDIFEALSDTTERDSKILVWSPEEEAVHPQTWIDKCGRSQTSLITDLEAWFMAFGKARNSIIHEGEVSGIMYPGSNITPTHCIQVCIPRRFLLHCRVLASWRRQSVPVETWV